MADSKQLKQQLAQLKHFVQAKPLVPSALKEQEGQGALAAQSALALSESAGKLPARGVKLGEADGQERNTEKWLGIALGGGVLATLWRLGKLK